MISVDRLTEDRAIIQLLHGRLGHDLAKSLAYHTGNAWYIKELDSKNQLITAYLDILDAYQIVGDEEVTNRYNFISVEDLQSIIDYCYRALEVYNR